MTEDKDSLLEQMRKGRQTFEAIYLQFSNNRKFYNSYAEDDLDFIFSEYICVLFL